MKFPTSAIVPVAAVALLLLGLLNDARAASPAPLLSLWQRVPDMPDTAPAAARWLDAEGRIAHPGLRALQADLRAHQDAVARIQQQAAATHAAQSAVVTEDLGQGLADVGIDMARAQRDPAYAQEVQERMRKMSPQELMAMSQKMSRPLNADKRHRNAAQAMVDDAPAVREAAQAGEAYAAAREARLATQQAIWREADEAVARLLKTPLRVPAARPAMEWDNIGCDKGCRAQWEAHADQMLPLMVARDTEVLRIRRAAWLRHRAALADGMRLADRQLVAADYGAASQSQVNQMYIVGYDGAAVAELVQVLDRLQDGVTRAAAVTRCGRQAVLVPNAVCP